MYNAEEALVESIHNSGKDMIYFATRYIALTKLAEKQLSQGNIIGHETKAMAEELAYSYSKLTETDLKAEANTFHSLLKSVIAKRNTSPDKKYDENTIRALLSARRVPEKIINKIAQMYAYDLQTAYEKGLRD